jgi:hypothetical protein
MDKEKHGNFQVIFNSSTQTIPNKVVLNHETSKEFKAIINFGKAKINLFTNIYNWRITYPSKIIHLALGEITPGFRFPQISADLTGNFGCIAEKLYFISTSQFLDQTLQQVLGKPWGERYKKIITVFSTRSYLVQKHRELLLKWQEDAPVKHGLIQAFACEMSPGVMKKDPGVCAPLLANIYVDDILAAAVHKTTMERLLAGIIKASRKYGIY